MSNYHLIKVLSNSSLSILKRSPVEFHKRSKEDYPDSSYTAVVFDGGNGEIIGLEMHE